MPSRSWFRLEWISLVYLGLFVLAVLSPSLVTHGWFGVNEVHVEEVMIFIFGIVGLTTFSLYQRLMEKTEKEHASAKTEYERARRELVESYQYIGSINRQIELLTKIANQTSQKIIEEDGSIKDLLSQLASSAASSVSATKACIRYVDLTKLRTNYEIVHSADRTTPFAVSNKDLKRIHDERRSYDVVRADDHLDILVVPSDHSSTAIRAYLLIPSDKARAAQTDIALLKVFANQAHLLHHIFQTEGHGEPTPSPLELVEKAKSTVVGDVR